MENEEVVEPLKCPKCNSEDYHGYHYAGTFSTPEATIFCCEDCGHTTDPE